ncbi:uncharacterized protein LOC6041664 isoform X2 [Culex quinquefasciatus]|uniref:uncharacterized protein LOC6041664 isoform X2 n=1 Tax=Culex quinquefasciatus TaxID=7176 RepID=UPI0018E3BCEA|nr:uncharacterized protein LOC6041664 isoform X2 [Culex quinquefasciatus]
MSSFARFAVIIILLPTIQQIVATQLPASLPIFQFDQPSSSVPIFQFDDPYQCRANLGTYCFVSTLRRIPENARTNREYPRRLSVHFRRELLEWGLCTKQCGADVSHLTKADRALLKRPHFSSSSLKYPDRYFPERIYMEKLFGDLMQVCVNYRLLVLYNFKGYPDLENCITSTHMPWQFLDWYVCLFYMILFTWIISFSMCNVLDLCGPRLFRRYKIVQAASIRLNWIRLTKYDIEDKLSEIRCIEGLRFLLILATIAFNCFMLMITFPVDNPEKVEQLLNNPLVINILSCMFWIIPAFLTIDGFLLMCHFLNFREKCKEFCACYFWYEFLNRLVESYPLYTMVLLYTSIMDTVWGGAPSVGRYLMMTREARFCRKNVWSNLLLVNNYPSTSLEMCYAPGWYFAASTHMFVLGSALLCLTWVFPKIIKYIKWTVPMIAIILPGVGAYLFPSAPLPPLQLNDIQSGFMYQTWYRMMYLPTHMNAGCYLVGMLSGYYSQKSKIVERYSSQPARRFCSTGSTLFDLVCLHRSTRSSSTTPLPSSWPCVCWRISGTSRASSSDVSRPRSSSSQPGSASLCT